MATRSLSHERLHEQAGEARRAFEVVVDRPWSRRASLWLDALVVLSEQDE
jgi:hypothetical protein